MHVDEATQEHVWRGDAENQVSTRVSQLLEGTFLLRTLVRVSIEAALVGNIGEADEVGLFDWSLVSGEDGISTVRSWKLHASLLCRRSGRGNS